MLINPAGIRKFSGRNFTFSTDRECICLDRHVQSWEAEKISLCCIWLDFIASKLSSIYKKDNVHITAFFICSVWAAKITGDIKKVCLVFFKNWFALTDMHRKSTLTKIARNYWKFFHYYFYLISKDAWSELEVDATLHHRLKF